MYKQYLLFFILFINSVFSRSVIFKIISFGTKTQVKIVGGKKYTLKPVGNDEILYGGRVNNAPEGEFNYYYIIDGVKEEFERTFSADRTRTFNDFFGREETVMELNTFEHPPSLKTWDRSVGKSKLFDDSYIPTVHITGDYTEEFFHKPTSKSIRLEKMSFYLKDSVKTFDNVSATAKNKNFSKFQIRFLLGNEGINGRYLLKLRNGAEDPLNLRQFVYGNMIQAIGVPSIHSVMVRVYYNKKPAGFYTLQEEAYSESFVKNEFYGDAETGKIHPPNPIGFPIDGEHGSDFEYQPNNSTYYRNFKGNLERLILFTEAIENLDPMDENAVAEFEDKWFDIDTFHKSMAMEYLTGDWDGYWYATSNFAVYDDPTQSTENTFKHYFISQDHDETFGVGLVPPFNTVGDDFTKLSYTTMLNKEWNVDALDPGHRVLVDKFISGSPALQQRFQDTLIAIVETIFNPVAVREVVESYRIRFTPEMEWDYSFERPYDAGKRPGVPIYELKHFLENFENGVGGLHWGLYTWVQERAEAIKNEFCITWFGDENPPDSSCVPQQYF
ncbi:hypothetical protein BCR32DRAFT_208105 [Anaeromyces robustus]|jgi:hypothetical protein|uniref:Coth-domain-containing protein n=1 Tax=Anaeromyces robustus TaxID=1754192 RepID=A0A1Y1WUM2_9FUNG|nr:hypothetical protein BCR32DRAFT_208105 [Anaeromyces robustus]|eukprot:ORX77251.1 hypothetical protein BCR32DRAFT_208105 [Anaeromyces robustus]